MGKVIIGATMSLDGFMNDRNGDVSRLYPDLEALRRTGCARDFCKKPLCGISIILSDIKAKTIEIRYCTHKRLSRLLI